MDIPDSAPAAVVNAEEPSASQHGTHQVSQLLPMLPPQDYERLKANIQRHGLRVPSEGVP
jgi:hypothetical protein